jgi:hypothetical protein
LGEGSASRPAQFHFAKNITNCRIGTSSGGNDILSATEMTLSPSPAADLLNVSCTGEWSETISLFDLQGKQVKSLTTSELNLSLDISALPSGIYLLRRETQLGEMVTRKFVKE